jgi:23S rRNA (cytosine1962-C5)-methyltransferase
MSCVNEIHSLDIRLRKDLARSIKQGHAWIFSDAIDLPDAPSGSTARLLGKQGQVVASGIYCGDHPIPVRICATEPPWVLDHAWFISRWESAVRLRETVIPEDTTGYRLLAGEGDGLPGLVVDIYGDTAVLKLDAGAPQHFYHPPSIAELIAKQLPVNRVLHRPRGRGTKALSITGDLPENPVGFTERGLRFRADVISGQKTGFFLDQRENRHWIRALARGKRVLNLFSFSAGFSIAAGVGGAVDVTSVDVAGPAIAAGQQHWKLNGLPEDSHHNVVADCFDFLQHSIQRGRTWDLIVCDPPSFAPSQKTRQAALSAYSKLAEMCSALVEPDGILAMASCSSHITMDDFTAANLLGLGKARCVGRLLGEKGLPPDHPTPLAMPELRYLKFQLIQVVKKSRA